MKKFLLALLLLAGCSGPGKTITVRLVNSTSAPLEVHAAMGQFSRVIRIGPGETWTGWIPNRSSVRQVVITIRDRKP